jgi:hypothetical protein
MGIPGNRIAWRITWHIERLCERDTAAGHSVNGHW